MKTVLSGILGLILMTHVSLAQTGEHKFGISAGGGPQDYKSSVGNGFSLSKKNSWHGAALIQAATYLNPSFDLVFMGAIGDLGPSRLITVGILAKYKFADDYLLPESSLLKPYVYAGMAFNNLIDKVEMSIAPTGNYMSLNAGLGVRYYVMERIHMGYNLALGYFMTAGSDFKAHSHTNELFMHNALMLGIDVF